MNVFLTEDLRDFVRKKVESGQFTSEIVKETDFHDAVTMADQTR